MCKSHPVYDWLKCSSEWRPAARKLCKKGTKNKSITYWAASHGSCAAYDQYVEEKMRRNGEGWTDRTGCIDWAPACCSVTSGSGGKLPGRAAPWCCPYWSHRHNDSPGRRAPCRAWWDEKKGSLNRRRAKSNTCWMNSVKYWKLAFRYVIYFEISSAASINADALRGLVYFAEWKRGQKCQGWKKSKLH